MNENANDITLDNFLENETILKKIRDELKFSEE